MSSKITIHYSQYHIIVLVLLLIISLVVYYLYTYTQTATESDDYELKVYPKNAAYKVPNISIRDSAIGGRGVFAEQNYNINDVIEIAPSIKQKDLECGGAINDYTYDFGENDVLIAFGYCSVYNHKDDPNANFEVLNEHQMKITAVKPIQQGTEIFISYGPNYFKERAHITQNK